MENATYYSIFMLGLLGTGHCLGMCGPLVIAFPGRTGGSLSHLCYHTGRIATYTALGAAMGAIGAGVNLLAGLGGGDPLVWVARIQVGVSLAVAAFLLYFGLARLGFVREPEWMSLATASRLPGYRRAVGSLSAERSGRGMIMLGLMMGLLPCGLSFAAFASALASGNPVSGGLLALIFGLGTLPGLMALGTGAAGILRRYRVQSDILSGLLMIGMAAVMAADAIGAFG